MLKTDCFVILNVMTGVFFNITVFLLLTKSCKCLGGEEMNCWSFKSNAFQQ